METTQPATPKPSAIETTTKLQPATASATTHTATKVYKSDQTVYREDLIKGKSSS